jgi:predicted amidohydrolase/CubicO group peptidase (beta-lactamase class C family)
MSAHLIIAALLSLASPAAESPSMAFPGEDWEEAAPESQGLDRGKLAEAIAYLEKHSGRDGVKELVLVRNGRLVWSGSAAARRHGVWSVTKSFTSTAFGLLVDRGKCALETLAKEHAPELAEMYGELRLEHFASMTSGYRAEGDAPQGGYKHGPSSTPFRPAAPLFSPPGSSYAYWDSAMNAFGRILTRIAGEPLEALLRREIAEPIGLEGWSWGDFGEEEGARINGGAGNHGKHVVISARELARLGHLFLNRGRWRDRQLLSAAWVEAATSVQVPASLPLGHAESGIDGRGVYGLNWWVNDRSASGERRWPAAPPGTFAALGYNNNHLIVVPEWGMVIVRLGLDQGDREITTAVVDAFLEKIGEALIEADAELGAWRLEASREEIAPRAWKDARVFHEGRPALALAGGGSPAANGCWTRALPVEAGKHYRFAARFAASGVAEPSRSVLARLIWRGPEGKTIGQAEYPPSALQAGSDGWSLIEGIYQAPASAREAKLELVFRWDAGGRVHFTPAVLEPVAPPAARKVRLAAVHHRPRGSKGPADNLERFAVFVAQAAERKADIVCLPEGVTVVGTGKSYVEVSEPVPGPSTRFLGELARKHGLHIAAGIYEREGSTVYNTAVLLDREGALAGKYRKVCLPREEIDGGITPGDELPVFDTPHGKVGLMICWDVFFPEPARVLARRGAEVILLPIWGGDLTLARARAIENQVYLVTSSYDMKTAVFDRRGEILAEGSEKEPVILVEIDLAERTLWPWLGDFQSRIPREMPSEKALRLAAPSGSGPP